MDTKQKITKEGIIAGIGSPYGEGATYVYGDPEHPEWSHLDESERKELMQDLSQLEQEAYAKGLKEARAHYYEKVDREAREDERKKAIKSIGLKHNKDHHPINKKNKSWVEGYNTARNDLQKNKLAFLNQSKEAEMGGAK